MSCGGAFGGVLLLLEEVHAFGDGVFVAGGFGAVVVFGGGGVLLGDGGVGVVVGVEVGWFGGFVLGFDGAVFEVFGDGGGAVVADVVGGFFDGEVAGVAFGGCGEVGGGLCEGDAGFGHADVFDGLHGGDGDGEAAGVGVADVFGGGDDEAAGDEAGVFAAFEHAGEPVDGGVGVGAADGFDVGGDGVVVAFFVFVVGDHAALDAVFHGGECDGLAFGGGEDGDFEGGECAAGVAFGDVGEEAEGFGGDVGLAECEAVLGVVEGAVEELFDGVDGEGFEFEDEGAGREGGVDEYLGVVGGGADEGDGAVFDVGEQDVLLGFVEAVDLVDEEDGAGDVAHLFGGFAGGADGGDVAEHAAAAFEAAAGGAGDDFGEGCFAAAGGSVEDEVGEAVGFDEAGEEFAGAEDVVLSGDVGEGARAHAGGERRRAVGGGLGVGVWGVIEEVGGHGRGRCNK